MAFMGYRLIEFFEQSPDVIDVMKDSIKNDSVALYEYAVVKAGKPEYVQLGLLSPKAGDSIEFDSGWSSIEKGQVVEVLTNNQYRVLAEFGDEKIIDQAAVLDIKKNGQ